MYNSVVVETCLLSLTACGGKEPAGQDVSAAGKKDSVVIAIGDEPETLDPAKGWGHGNAPIIQSTLVRYAAAMSFENDMLIGHTDKSEE